MMAISYDETDSSLICCLKYELISGKLNGFLFEVFR